MEDNIKIEDGKVILKINPKLYPLDLIYSASYIFLDRAYVLLAGDPEKEILVRLKPKTKEELDNLGDEFMNELINYANYHQRSEQTMNIREMLLHRALMTNDPDVVNEQGNSNDIDHHEMEKKEADFLAALDEEEDYIDDPDGIAVPWDEKHGKEEKEENQAEEDVKEHKRLEECQHCIEDPEGTAVPGDEKHGKEEKEENQAEEDVKEHKTLEECKNCIEDQEETAVPWDEKYGKEGENKQEKE